ncbi:MAG TPA: penicillin-binding protein 2 [Candidatus Paceibacterota bacterium]|nr:penicillin-binding protein 2 [Candidatus Paceibacterota bacterium]
MAYRFSLIIALIAVAYGALLFHLYEIQLVKGNYYYAKAASEVAAAVGTNGTRGAIYFTDLNGNELPAAIEKQFPIVYAVPSAIDDPAEAAHTVAPILDMPASTLQKLFSKPHDDYELLVRKADPSVANGIEDADVKGVYADVENDRYYPLGTVASQVLGYVGPNASNTGESGHYGLESFYNGMLEGVSTSGPSAQAVGADLQLTIDPNIQIEAEKVLGDLVEQNHATGGSVIVADPQTGRILAMGGDPGFDPNSYGDSPIANFLNTNVQAVYEPGSILKVITMAAGIDAGKITPNTTYTDKGFLKIGPATITNYDYTTHGPYGAGTTMTNVIEHSINTGAIFAENQTGNSTFEAYLKKFGLDGKTGIDMPGEVAGNLSELSPKAPQIAFDTAAYGQGIAVTPIELVSAIGAIANGGTLMRPYVNAALAPQPIRRVIATSTAALVTQMMVSAVDKAQIANIAGYALAGKTGSAFIPDLVHGGYTNNLIDSYIGFGPASHPRFIAFIRLNTLPATALAAQSVVPAFKELSQYIINYYSIPPDRIGTDAQP